MVQVGTRSVVFGHAVYEGAALLFHEAGGEWGGAGPRRVVAREVLRLAAAADESEAALIARVDAALVTLLAGEEPLRPETFPRACSLFGGNSPNAG